jgi:hypothetical protein
MARAYSNLSLKLPMVDRSLLDMAGKGVLSSNLLAVTNATDRTRGLLELTEPSWLKTITGTAPASGLLAVANAAADVTRFRASYAALIPKTPSVIGSFGKTFEALRVTWAGFEDVDRFIETWERDALWMLLENLGIGTSRRLAQLPREEVEACVLDAIEHACSDGKYVPALRKAVAAAPYLNSSQREQLDHALEHAGEGEYVKASGSLYFGLEGAYREAAYAAFPETRPTGTKKALGFEKLVKLTALAPELKTFVVRGVFGGSGNVVRHGHADGSERRQVLLGVAALAAWIERFSSEPALELLAAYLEVSVPRAIDAAPALMFGRSREAAG